MEFKKQEGNTHLVVEKVEMSFIPMESGFHHVAEELTKPANAFPAQKKIPTE